jgi:release factor glutamine methyltransferase
MSSVSERIAEGRRTLVAAGIRRDDAALDADVLARHALGWDRARLVAEQREEEPDGFAARFSALVDRRARREPVAFIVGHREFWGLDLEINRDVLIPRPETELVVEAVLALRPRRSDVRRIVDVGTGSGCLAIALAKEYEDAHVIAVDISTAALSVARRNVERHGVGDRVHLMRGDLVDAIAGPVDVIVSNPPYVPAGVELAPEIVRHEPPVALYSGDDGMTAIERLIRDGRARLAGGGLFVVEFGFGQDERVEVLARAAGWVGVVTNEDLQGIPRVATMLNVS